MVLGSAGIPAEELGTGCGRYWCVREFFADGIDEPFAGGG